MMGNFIKNTVLLFVGVLLLYIVLHLLGQIWIPVTIIGVIAIIVGVIIYIRRQQSRWVLMGNLHDEIVSVKKNVNLAFDLSKLQDWPNITKAVLVIFGPIGEQIKQARKKFKKLYTLED